MGRHPLWSTFLLRMIDHWEFSGEFYVLWHSPMFCGYFLTICHGCSRFIVHFICPNLGLNHFSKESTVRFYLSMILWNHWNPKQNAGCANCNKGVTASGYSQQKKELVCVYAYVLIHVCICMYVRMSLPLTTYPTYICKQEHTSSPAPQSLLPPFPYL